MFYGVIERIIAKGGQPSGQPFTYDFSVITEKGVTTFLGSSCPR
jgi:hypothetical protein